MYANHTKNVLFAYMCSHQQLKNTWNIAEEVNILQQRCFLQPITHEKKKKRKNEKEQHIVFVYFDIEAQQDTGNHIANLVCAETDQNDTQFTFQGKDCNNNLYIGFTP